MQVLTHKILEIGDNVLPRKLLGGTGIIIEKNTRSKWMLVFGRLVLENRGCRSIEDQLTRNMGFKRSTIENLLIGTCFETAIHAVRVADEWPEAAWEPPCGKTGSYAGERYTNLSLNDTVGLWSARWWMTSDQAVIVTNP